MDFLMEFGAWLVQTLFWVLVWYIVGMFLLQRLVQKQVQYADSEVQRIITDLETKQLIPLLVEVERNTYLCYNCLTKDFVCQGTNIEEIMTRFKQRYPSRYCSLSQGQPEVLDILKKQLKEYNESLSGIGSPS